MPSNELIWQNGRVSELASATAHIEDRGHQFADGVYEVIRVYNGNPFTLTEHLERLARSADGIRLFVPLPLEALAAEIRTLISRAQLRDGMIYLQLTRGIAPRNHVFPQAVTPTLYFYTRALPPVPTPGTAPGAKLVTVDDERWKRCWVKSIALLPNVLAKNFAVEAGADEALFVEDGRISECSASNLFAVGRGVLVTAPVGPKVLPGITRQLLLELATELSIPVAERYPTEYECRCGEELFITSTTREISWVSHINNVQVYSSPGEITQRLHRALQARVRSECGVNNAVSV
jgi:D-alanine transaminase